MTTDSGLPPTGQPTETTTTPTVGDGAGSSGDSRPASIALQALSAALDAGRASDIAHSLLRLAESGNEELLAAIEDPRWDDLLTTARLTVESRGWSPLTRAWRALRRAIDSLAADAPDPNDPLAPPRSSPDHAPRLTDPDAGEPEMVVPSGHGYQVTARGVVQVLEPRSPDEEPRLVQVTDVPLAAVGLARVHGTDVPVDPDVVVRWQSPGMPVGEAVVPRSTLGKPRDLAPALVSAGCPLPAQQAQHAATWLVRQLSAQEASGALLWRDLGVRGGWCRVEGAPSCLLGTRLVLPDGDERPLTGAVPPLAGVAVRGEWVTWRGGIEAACADAPLLTVAVLGSVASVLSRLAGCRPGVLHWWGATSTGKTTALLAAASVWGDPASLVASWDATPIGIEARAALLDDLPLLLDELSLADHRAGRVAYQHAEGHGRSRGRRDGSLGEVRSWHGWLLSTGEQPLSERTSGGGAARLLDLEVKGGVVADGATARSVATLCTDHHGHLGLQFVRWLLASPRSRIRAIRQLYREAVDEVLSRLPGPVDGPMERRVAMVALLQLAGDLLDDAGLLRIPTDAAVSVALGVQMRRVDPAMVALQTLVRLVEAEPHRWWSPGNHDKPVPHAGWWGIQRDDGTIDLLARRLPEVCELAGLPPGSDVGVRATWAERGWLTQREAGRRTERTRLDGRLVRVLRLTRAALEAADREVP